MLLCFIISLVPCFLLSIVIIRQTKQSRIDEAMKQLQTQGKIIANQMVYNNYFSDRSDKMNSYLEQNAEFWSGRIQVINSDYKIILDTYISSEGKYFITQEIMEGFQGKVAGHYDEDHSYLYLVQPVIDGTEKVQGVLLITSNTVPMEEAINQVEKHSRILLLLNVCLLWPIIFFILLRIFRPLKKLAADIEKAARLQSDQLLSGNSYYEMKRIEGAFNKTMKELKVLDESRQEFVSNVAHELKTPITSMKILADSINTMDGAPLELYQEFMGDISEEIDRESKIIEDLLSLTRLEQGGVKIQPEIKNINEMMELLLKRLRPIALDKSVELLFESFRPVTADVDEVKLTLAFSNLVENAIKYNKEGGWVKVTLNADPGFFYVKVADSGCGIPESELNRVFDRFYRVDKARSRESGGTGLGLSITKTIVALHKGEIKAYSQEGEGTTFVVRIPLHFKKEVQP